MKKFVFMTVMIWKSINSMKKATLLLAVSSIIGCNQPPQQGDPATPSDYQFTIPSEGNARIATEFPEYWLTGRENRRNIWIGGNLAGTTSGYNTVWWVGPNNLVRNAASPSHKVNNIYYQPLEIDNTDLTLPAPGEESTVTYKVRIGYTVSTQM